MKNFQYYNPARILFGQGAEKNLEALLKQAAASSVLLVYSGEFVKELGIFQEVQDACERLNIAFYEDGSVVPNPQVELVRSLIEEGKEKKVDFVLAAGGGSAIDTAKSIALGVPYQGDVWDFFSGKAQPETSLPVGVVATLPASGSETSNCAILSNGVYKAGFEDDSIIPKFAILNPEYTKTLPAYQTACGVADILSHLLERYFSDVPDTDVTDYLIEGAVKALLLNGQKVLEKPEDYQVRAQLQWLASIAHNNLLDTGREADWGSHRIEHEISGQYGITHGEGMAVVLPAWIRYAAEKKPQKPAQLAARVFGYDTWNYSVQQLSEKLAEELETYFRKLGLKTTLKELGITEEHFKEMADRATENDSQKVGHYLKIGSKEIIGILKKAR